MLVITEKLRKSYNGPERTLLWTFSVDILNMEPDQLHLMFYISISHLENEMLDMFLMVLESSGPFETLVEASSHAMMADLVWSIAQIIFILCSILDIGRGISPLV